MRDFFIMKIKKIITAVLPVLMLIAEILPVGAVLVFKVPTETGTETLRMTYSYFDLTPMGYANVGPLFCAVFSVFLILSVVLLLIFPSKKTRLAAQCFCIMTFVFSVLPIMFGAEYLSVAGAVITALSVAEFFILSAPAADKNVK